VLIIDELQKIGDLKIDGYLIYELFNLFIRLTKELHCCHVFAVTSDSLFIERVYAEAMLQGRCRYLLVDDFDFETTKGFLGKYGFSKEEIELTWNYFGGKPVYLVEAVKNKHRLKDFCEEMLRIRIGQIEEIVFRLEVEDVELFKKVVELLENVKEKGEVRYRFVTDAISFLVKNNVIFADPTVKVVRPQSKLDLLAIRRILEVIR
jgi:AAA+ ATPase superfamily predicted ATPase